MDVFSAISHSIIAPLWATWERSPYLHHYRNLLKTQYAPVDVIRGRQLEDVRNLLCHAYKTIPFWKQRMNESGLDPEHIWSLDDLQILPLLTKFDLREQGEQLLSSQFSKHDLHVHTTSGSTGTSVVTYSDEACQQFKRGATLRSDEWSGWRLGERRALIWGNPQIRSDWKGKIRRALLERDYVYLDTLLMTERSMEEFAEILISKPPSMLFGHAHSLYLFACYLKSQKPHFTIRPRAIISTCMVLHVFERECIEDIFSCSVTNRYGCEEVSLIACECKDGAGLHVNADCLYVELLDKAGKHCQPGVPGRVVVTDLKNWAMPIIRYEVGDMAVWADRSCSCGRTLPLLERVEGRVADYVVTAKGEFISGISLTENFAVKVPGVAQMQIVQNDLSNFTFNIVKGNSFGSESLLVIDRLVQKYFGDDVSYDFHYVDKIRPDKSGKHRFCISNINKETNVFG